MAGRTAKAENWRAYAEVPATNNPRVERLWEKLSATGDGDGETRVRLLRKINLEQRGVRYCRRCLCAEHDACVNEAGESCHWVADDLCSACADGTNPDGRHADRELAMAIETEAA